MERYVIVIPAEGPCRLVLCDDGDTCKLNTLQQLVGGPIEVTPSCLSATWAREPVDGINVIVNEEGRLRGLPCNKRASDLSVIPNGEGRLCSPSLNGRAPGLWIGNGIRLLMGDALLAAAKGEDLIGFTKPVCKTIAESWDLEMEDGTWND